MLPLVRRRLPAARLPFEDLRVLAAIGATLVATAVLRRRFGSSALREGIVQATRRRARRWSPCSTATSPPTTGSSTRRSPPTSRGSTTRPAVPKEHDRCGSNLIAPMMLLSAGGTVLLERLVERPGPLARAGVGLGGASIAVEMFAWSDRHHGDPLAEAFHTPGREIQRLVATKEPTPEQLEVGVAALAEILRAEKRGVDCRRHVTCAIRGSTTSASPSRISTPRIELYEKSFEMELAHRETVEAQGVEAVLLDVGDGPRRAAAPARPRHRRRQVPRPQGPRPAPRRLRGRRHRRDAGEARGRRASS